MRIEFTLELPPFSPSLIAELGSLSEAVFLSPVTDIQWRLEKMPCASVFCARSGSQLIGFKAGYAMSQTKYYSWLGGAHPEFRLKGVASKLMERQHEWLQACGYKLLETATDQDNLPMYKLNQKHGLVVCGLRNEPHRVQVLFSKSFA